MADLRFYDRADPISLGDLATAIGASLSPGADASVRISDVAATERVQPGELCFAATAKAVGALAGRSFGAIITTEALASSLSSGNVLLHADPNLAFAKAATRFYPKAARDFAGRSGAVDETARIASDAMIEPGVVIGAGVEIGAGSHIAANAVLGRGVAVGRDCYIGPGASVLCALLGDRVIVHGGARLGSDGFGYASGAHGHFKIPQLGRVIVQDDVEIGANTTIDRGALGDTVIGEGVKIDNLVQIGHNCTIGRNAILVSHVGLSGSVTVGDWAVLAGKVGVADHVTIGPGARVAAKSGVTKNLAGGKDYGGIPAKPIADWRREMVVVRRLGQEARRRDE